METPSSTLTCRIHKGRTLFLKPVGKGWKYAVFGVVQGVPAPPILTDPRVPFRPPPSQKFLIFTPKKLLNLNYFKNYSNTICITYKTVWHFDTCFMYSLWPSLLSTTRTSSFNYLRGCLLSVRTYAYICLLINIPFSSNKFFFWLFLNYGFLPNFYRILKTHSGK